jgi:hypothetical protein
VSMPTRSEQKKTVMAQTSKIEASRSKSKQKTTRFSFK